MEDDDRWMERGLELARRGTALASPNPMVGCVIVRDGEVVGEGFHTYDGIKHAEILALEHAGETARGATLYVNLEPCCHEGRTGPCTGAIIAAGVKRVVAAMRDPNPQVAGRGLEQLQKAGIEVVTSVREGEARRLNEAFARHVTSGLPLVTLKSALSLDWRIAPPPKSRNARNRWITSVASRKEVQRMRHAHDAVLTGIGTVLADDPLLTDRTSLPRRRKLLRVVLDSKLRLPLKSKLVKTANNDVLVFTCLPLDSRRATKLRDAGIELVRIVGKSKRIDLRAVLGELGRLNVQSVMIEAGTGVNTAICADQLVDRMALFFSDKVLGEQAVPFVRQISANRAATRDENAAHRFPSDLKPTLSTLIRILATQGLFFHAAGPLQFREKAVDMVSKRARQWMTNSYTGTGIGWESPHSAMNVHVTSAAGFREIRLRRIGPDVLVEGDLRDVYGDH